MKIYEIKSMTTDDLRNRLKEESEGLENLRFQRSLGQLESFKSIQNTRRLIARINTIIKEREMSQEISKDKKDK
jgi:large subunit ribosomal protein L29